MHKSQNNKKSFPTMKYLKTIVYSNLKLKACVLLHGKSNNLKV